MSESGPAPRIGLRRTTPTFTSLYGEIGGRLAGFASSNGERGGASRVGAHRLALPLGHAAMTGTSMSMTG